jgi:hypothetical protein
MKIRLIVTKDKEIPNVINLRIDALVRHTSVFKTSGGTYDAAIRVVRAIALKARGSEGNCIRSEDCHTYDKSVRYSFYLSLYPYRGRARDIRLLRTGVAAARSTIHILSQSLMIVDKSGQVEL